MSSRILIASPQEASVITSEALAAAAEVHFGDRAEVVRQSESPVDLVVYVAPADGPPFSIAHFRDDRSVSVDGTPRQNAEVASWLRAVLPMGFPRLIAFDESWTRHVELSPAITADEIERGWVDHTTPGWNAGNPDLG